MDKNIKLLSSSSLNGIVQMSISIFWIYFFSRLLYLYQKPNLLFFYKLPNWTLILFIGMGLIGGLIGLTVIFKNRKVWNGYLILTSLFIIGLIINYIVVSY